MAQKRYLVISMEIDDTAPGIVFKNLLRAMARRASVTVICPRIDASFLGVDVEILPINFHQHSWRILERRWRFLGCNPAEEFRGKVRCSHPCGQIPFHIRAFLKREGCRSICAD